MKRKLEYKWVVAGICFLMVFAALGLCSSNKSLYLGAITDALGVPRSAFSLNDTCRYVTQVIINMFFGTLVNKFGTKKLMCAGFLCLATSSTIYAFAKSIYIFYIGGVFLGLGLSWTTTTMVGFVVGKWFKEKKGTVAELLKMLVTKPHKI
jgi:MFS family permease